MPHASLPHPSLAALGRKIRVDSLLDHYLDGSRLPGALEPPAGLPKHGPSLLKPSKENQP
jgi:hypothetical protein